MEWSVLKLRSDPVHGLVKISCWLRAPVLGKFHSEKPIRLDKKLVGSRPRTGPFSRISENFISSLIFSNDPYWGSSNSSIGSGHLKNVYVCGGRQCSVEHATVTLGLWTFQLWALKTVYMARSRRNNSVKQPIFTHDSESKRPPQ